MLKPLIAACLPAFIFTAGFLPPSDALAQTITQDSDSRIDLSGWKLTLPTSENGTYKGNPKEVKASALLKGFRDEHFHTDDEGAIVFWCPVNGCTTKARHSRAVNYGKCWSQEIQNETGNLQVCTSWRQDAGSWTCQSIRKS